MQARQARRGVAGDAELSGPTSFGDGPVAGGNVIYIFDAGYGTARSVPREGALDPGLLRRLRTTYVRVAAYDSLLEGLERHRVQALRGPERSGRFTTAALALAEISATVVSLDPESSPRDLTTDDFRKGAGHVLVVADPDAAGGLGRSLLSYLTGCARLAEAYLVLVVGGSAGMDDIARDGYLVAYQPPDPGEVLRAHLDVLLHGEARSTVQGWLGHDAVRRELATATGPGEIADLAGYLAQGAMDRRSRDDVLGGLRGKLRERVQRQFRHSDSDADADATLRRQAFLFACAVLNGFTLTQVTSAAERLVELLQAVESGDAPQPRPVFRDSLSGWLGQVEAVGAGEPAQRARLLHDAAPETVLEVAWDYEAARAPLLDWLGELATGPDELVRVCAAQAVGKLATFDFDHVYRRVVSPWAGSGRPVERQAAAWALEVVATDERLASYVLRRAVQWARSGSEARQRAAVLLYGTQLGAVFPDAALRDLRRLAALPCHARDGALAGSLVEIFRAGRQEQGRNPWQRQQLWRLTLAEQGTSWRPWETLRRWLERAADDQRSLDRFSALAAELAGDPWLRNRICFYLRLWRLRQQRLAEAADHVLSRLEEG